MSAAILVRTLRAPESVSTLTSNQWTGLLCAARAEQLAGTLADRLVDIDVPEPISSLLDMARRDAEASQRTALWEAEMARRALEPLELPVILLKGAAFVAAGLAAARGRQIGDLDILVPRARLDDVEQALLHAGWEWVKADAYDQSYYRRWMHELPPLIHATRDRMIDVHHTILPLTARPTPDADALIADSLALPSGLRILSPEDRIVHAAAHLLADGDMAGGLRNLWDIDRMLQEPIDLDNLRERARLHRLERPTARAVRLAARIYGTPVAPPFAVDLKGSDHLFLRRLLARDGWGRGTRPLTRFGFYTRGHVMRMPPLMLARHLLIKATAGKRAR